VKKHINITNPKSKLKAMGGSSPCVLVFKKHPRDIKPHLQ